MHSLGVAQAYARSARHRSLRDQEADVFLRVNGVLRGVSTADALALTKALADNTRLWMTVMDLVRDPANRLPPKLRAAIFSVGLAVERESARETPDLAFLIGLNEQMAAGLSGL